MKNNNLKTFFVFDDRMLIKCFEEFNLKIRGILKQIKDWKYYEPIDVPVPINQSMSEDQVIYIVFNLKVKYK